MNDNGEIMFIYGLALGFLITIFVLLALDIRGLGAKQHYKNEIVCETLKNGEIICYNNPKMDKVMR